MQKHPNNQGKACSVCRGPIAFGSEYVWLDPDTGQIDGHRPAHRSCYDLARYNAAVARSVDRTIERQNARAELADRYYPAGLLF